MLIAIVSMPSEIGRREAIRKSWTNNTNVNKNFTKVVFIIGKTGSDKAEIESAKYNDIIFTDITERYYNLSLKTFAIFDFAHKQCFNVECIIKADSDNILNVRGFEELCQTQIVNKTPPMGYIGGFCNVSTNIHRETGNKWHIPYYVYSEEKLPKYCSSGVYAYFGRNSWHSIYKSCLNSQFFYSSNMRHLPEDVLFTGIFANYAEIPRINIPGFSYQDKPKIFCGNKFIVSLFGYILSAIASIVINEEPAFFSIYDLSVIVGTFQLFIHILWLISMISIVKGGGNDDDYEMFDVNEETFSV
uniref:Hexosyltransferase n=1 Tax=Panagrolaimus sp. PS1159 TaxID=55785 RepID=A0AC35FNP4_9BILA